MILQVHNGKFGDNLYPYVSKFQMVPKVFKCIFTYQTIKILLLLEKNNKKRQDNTFSAKSDKKTLFQQKNPKKLIPRSAAAKLLTLKKT